MTAPISAVTPQAATPTATGSPLAAITPAQEHDALESITQMLTGSQILKDEPGVVYALAQEKANPADSGAIDQFMQGLDAEKQVRIAQAAGTKINLTAQQKTLLTGLNVDYSGVEYTQQNALADTAAQMEAQGQTVKRDANGNPVLDANGNIETVQPKAYKAKGIGRLFQTLHNDIIKPLTRNVVSPTLGGLNDAWNVVDQTLGSVATGYDQAVNDLGVVGDLIDPAQAVHQIWKAADGSSVQLTPKFGGIPTALRAAVGGTDDQLDQMRQAGYDPTNFFSVLAYRAKGKAHSDLTPLEQQWDAAHPNAGPISFADALTPSNGQEAVQEALKFTEDPKGYRQSIENDPTLTPDQVAQKLAFLGSKDFQTLTRKVQAARSSIGNEGATQLGIDPVKHPAGFAYASAGIDLAASFLVDPTVLLGKAVKIEKLSQVGIDSLGDSERAAKILDPATSTGVFARNVQRGWQRGIDLAEQIGSAESDVEKAKLTAQFNAELPSLAPLLPDFLGKDAIVGFGEHGPIFGETDGIHSLADAADYLSSKVALTRLMNGAAARQASLMPGALSAVGFRKLKGLTAGWLTERSATRAENAHNAVLSAAHADPALERKLIDDGDLIRLQPEADDAVDAISERVIAAQQATGEATASGGLASAQRGQQATQLALTPAGKGNIAYNLRATGNPLGGSIVGWASPTAIAARARLGAQRLSTLLPRNTLIKLNDAQSGDKLYKMAMTYLNRGDARMFQAAWNAGDGGQRKALIGAMLDQVTHAAGLHKTASGANLIAEAKTALESYSSVGDEAILDGQNLALHAGQVRTEWLLPTFRDIQKASSKLGLWEATMGRALTTKAADTLMTQWKMGALFKPSTITRNQLEGWGRTALEGQLGDALKSRVMLTMPNRELWARGFGAESKAEYERLIADGDIKGAEEVARGNYLGGDLLGRSKPAQTLAEFAPFALAGRAYRKLYGRALTDEDLRTLETLGKRDLSESLEGYGQQILESDLGFKNAARRSTEIAKDGYGPALLRRALAREKTRTGAAEGSSVRWTHQDADGTVGADRYANALAQRINATPNVARAVMDVLENPDEYDVQHVIMHLEDPKIAAKMHLTAFGKLYWEDGSTVARRAVTPEEVELGKVEFANKVINDYRYLLTGQNGRYQSDLASEIRQTGKAPDADWIANNLEGHNRPPSVLAPEVMAMPAGKITEAGVAQQLQDVEGAAYKWLVERPLQRTTSSPVFLANYIKARRGLDSYVEKLVSEHGLSEGAANEVAKELAIRNAWVKAEQLIDDPGQKSQFDIVARNMFPFSRATQAMIRRWGSGLWQDPTRARKMMLAYEGGVQSGLIYSNSYGEPTFTYPGSGVMNMLMRELAKVPGFESFAHFPISGTMTGQVLMSVPGADNPFRMSMGPMISIPMREIFKLFPGDRAQLDAIDSAINGPIGVGETWTQLIPGAARKIFTAMDTNQRNSALASATIGAIANLGAAGLVPGVGASPAERDAFLQRVKAQVRNQLLIRAAFGMFAPAAPSAPTDGTSGSNADYAFQMNGVSQLSDEYKAILNDVHGDLARANAIFTALHPDSAVWYETSHSQANVSKVSLPSTADALNWMTKNAGFVSKYKTVAAYFLPQPTGNEPFSDQAYKTQLELGLREKKTPDEFYNDVRIADAENVFYPMVAQYDAQIARAKTTGNSNQVAALTQAKSDWETQFKNMNPLFAAKIDSYPDARATAVGQLQDLHQMVQDGQVPNGQGPLLNALLQAYDGYNQFIQAHKGSDNASTQQRSAALDIFNNWAQENIQGTPLQDLYQGVFRALNTNFVSLSQSGG